MASLIIFTSSIFAGLLGSLLGLGGGIIVVPVLTLGFGVDIRYAIAASLVSIIATSSGAAASFLKDHLTNIRLGVLLEVGTVLGAISGFLVSSFVNTSVLYFLFGIFLLFSALMMLRRRTEHPSENEHPWAKQLGLSGTYPDIDGTPIPYSVSNVHLGLYCMYFAGAMSALLGIGSGIFKVLAMDGAMRLPMKVSSATSNFMIGVTASASAGAYFLRGDIRPEIAGPVALGIILGAWFGGKVMPRVSGALLRKIFVVVLALVSVQMILRSFR